MRTYCTTSLILRCEQSEPRRTHARPPAAQAHDHPPMTASTPAASAPASRLAAIVLILLAGIMTGAQLGKIALLIPWYGDTLGLSMVGAGWLVAILGVFIAVSALPAGWVIDRLGLRRSFVLGT